MAKITQERKETLLKVKEEINQLNTYIDNILEGKMHISEVANEIGMSNNGFRAAMDKGLYDVLKSKKIKIFDNETCFDILKSRQQPVEKLYQDVLDIPDDNILFITSIDHEQIKTIVSETLNNKLLYDRLSLYYGIDVEQMSYDKIANKYNRSRERIRQSIHKALRILRRPSNLSKLLLNYNKRIIELQDAKTIVKLSNNLDEQIKLIKNISLNTMNIHIEDLDLSVRSYNCLKRHGCKNVKDIVDIIKNGNIYKVRNLGEKSIQEIIFKLKLLNIKV